jgi:hypothetical protein
MTILDNINAQLAALVPVDRPAADDALGYGVDLSCVSDLTEDMRETDPESPEGIMESCVRFLTTDRDSIPGAPGRGWNLRRLLNRAFTAPEIEAQEGLAAQELDQDDRIDHATCALMINRGARTIKIRVRIFPKSLALQPFDFIATVTDGEALAELLK